MLIIITSAGYFLYLHFTQIDNSRWLDTYLNAAHPPSISKCTYQGQPVYYINQDKNCCDQLDEIHSLDGTFICAPGGGITGIGNGKCQGDLSNCQEIPINQLR